LTEPTPRRAGLLYTLVMTACADTATSDPVIRALVAHAARGGGHETAHEALRCAAARKLALDARELRSLSAQVIGGYCAARGSDEWKRHDWLLLARALGAAATPSTAVLAACESPVRRSAVRQVFGLPLEANDLAQLFASPERDAFDVADRLPCERAEVAALAEQACLKTATAAAARCLARAKRVVAPAVLAALAHGYLRALDDFDEHWAAEVLRVFHAAAHDRARTEPARAVLLAARKGADESSDLALRAGMTCLGDAQHAAALAQAREHPERHDRVHAKLLASDALAACTP
jgi:hypothetical protein